MEESVPGLEASKADLVGYGYDPNHLAEGRELTRDDLDPHFPDQPVMLLHVSLQGAVLNTALDKILEANPPRTFGRYHNHLKIGGVKIVADGSPQGRTGSFTTPYLTGGPGGEPNWRGEPSFPQDQLNEMFKKVYENNLRLLVHDQRRCRDRRGARGARVCLGRQSLGRAAHHRRPLPVCSP